MDSLHAIGFYASAGLSLGGGLCVAFVNGRRARAIALLGSGIGIAGVYASLLAGFAAAVALLSFAGCALLLARLDSPPVELPALVTWRQVGGAAAAVLLAALAYSAYRGTFAHVTFNGGAFGAAAVGRLLFARDALATEAIGALVLAALVGLTIAWRAHERSR